MMNVGGIDGGLVVAATVTYGDRGLLCERVIQAALASGVDQVVVVDNGATSSSRKILQKVAKLDSRVILTERGPNRGSADGFARAISDASSIGDFVWLLDDDNVPAPSALQELQSAFQRDLGHDLVLFSFRETDPHHARVARGQSAYPPPGSFLNFDVWTVLVRRFTRERPSKFGSNGLVEVPYGPYGGMYARSSTLRLVAPPLHWMELYEDDTDFSMRLRAAGAALYLSTQSRIRDIDSKWSEVGGRRGPARFLVGVDERKVNLAVRNRAYIDSVRGSGCRMRYWMNRWVFCRVAWLQAKRLGTGAAYEMLLAAIKDGESRGADHVVK